MIAVMRAQWLGSTTPAPAAFFDQVEAWRLLALSKTAWMMTPMQRDYRFALKYLERFD